MKQASKKMTTKEIRIEGIFEALKVALLRGIKSGGVTLGDYTVFFQVFEKDNMKEKIEDKLEEIINKYQIHTSIGIKESIDVCDEWDMKTMGVAINELSTLIQEERKEAVRGLVDYLEANTEKIFYLGCARMISEYLGTVESEGIEREKK